MARLARIHDATIVRVKDGDTLVLLIDLDFRVSTEAPVRLHGIDCPELPTPAGLAAKAFTEAWVLAHPAVIIQSYKDPDIYARWLGVIYEFDGPCLNEDLVAAGHAIRKAYH